MCAGAKEQRAVRSTVIAQPRFMFNNYWKCYDLCRYFILSRKQEESAWVTFKKIGKTIKYFYFIMITSFYTS